MTIGRSAMITITVFSQHFVHTLDLFDCKHVSADVV